MACVGGPDSTSASSAVEETAAESVDTQETADTADARDTVDMSPPRALTVDVFSDGLPAGAYRGLSVATDGTVWGTTTVGLLALDPTTGASRTYTSADNLIDDAPLSALAASDGTLGVGHAADTTQQGEQLSPATTTSGTSTRTRSRAGTTRTTAACSRRCGSTGCPGRWRSARPSRGRTPTTATVWITSSLYGVGKIPVGADVGTSTTELFVDPALPDGAVDQLAVGGGAVWAAIGSQVVRITGDPREGAQSAAPARRLPRRRCVAKRGGRLRLHRGEFEADSAGYMESGLRLRPGRPDGGAGAGARGDRRASVTRQMGQSSFLRGRRKG